MLEGDIICLGSNLPVEIPQQQRVVGIKLHVEKSGESEAYSLLFKRENTSVIDIGRRSGHEPDKYQCDSAMFRCAVVSRRHAKIVFSDGGHVYVVDSNSHHGTHLCKSGDVAPKPLMPEISTILNDGDILTFGKAVGKGDEWVKPVVVRVQLLCVDSQLVKALTLPSPSFSDKSRSSSGRYGIHDDRSLSSEDSHSSYSEIEEIPPPTSQNAVGPQQGGSELVNIPDLVRQVVELNQSFNDFRTQQQQRDQPKEKEMPEESFEFQPLEEREEVKASINALHELVDEMREIRDRTKSELSKDLVEVLAMREEAMKEIAKARAELAALSIEAAAPSTSLPLAQAQTPVLPSLKRKRDDMGEDEDGVDGSVELPALGPAAATEPKNLSEGSCENDLSDAPGELGMEVWTDLYDHAIHRPDDSPPRKRIRSVGSAIAQAATAVTIGAVVTWSALAFS